MAEARSINNSYQRSMEGGGKPEIAMPPLEEPSSQHQTQQAFSVPDELPEDTQSDMNEYVQEPVEEYAEETSHPIKKQGSPQESFKAIREAKERAEYERDMLLRQMEQYKQPAKQQEVQDKEDDFDIDEDALVEGKHLKAMYKEIQHLRKEAKNYQAQTYQSTVEMKLKAQYPDIEKVVNEKTIDVLKQQYPEIARSLSETTDTYSKAVSAYNIIKNFGIYKEDVYQQDRQRVFNNAQKPRPTASVSPQQGNSPLSKANDFANGMTKDLQAQLRREMAEARKLM